MTSSANASSNASTEERTRAAEEIARLLREEALHREPPSRAPEPPRPRRTAPSELPPPRPRRTAPIEVPPSRQVPSPRPPPLPPPPQPAGPETRPLPPVGGSGRRPTWLIFALIAVVLSIFGRFAEDVSTGPDDDSGIVPATTAPFDLDAATVAGDSALEPGTCIVWLAPGDNAVVGTVPCDESHQYEVFATVDVAASTASYPGRGEVNDLGYDACLGEFFAYVGENYEDSPWHLQMLLPSEEDWVEAGDRSASCLVYLPGADGPQYWEGTARGSGGAST